MSNSSRGRKSSQEVEILFCVSGLPPDVKWQDLKDSLRHDRNMRARPGWTDVMIQMSSGKAVRQGVFKIKDLEEANRVYYCLSQGLRDGTPLQVHQWDISRYPPELRDCNCPAIFGTSEHSPQLSTMGSQIANQISQEVIQFAPVQTVANPVVGIWDPQNTPLVIIAGSEDGKAGSPTSVRLTYPDCMQQDSIPVCMTTPQPGQGCAAPLLYTAQNGVPINTSHGAILAEMRGIFISGLIYSVTEKDVLKLLSQAGRVRACELRKDSKTGQSRGSATVLFDRKEDAQTAINMFNSCIYMGRTLTVRWDRDSTPLDISRNLTAQTQPVIVNGSTPYKCD